MSKALGSAPGLDRTLLDRLHRYNASLGWSRRMRGVDYVRSIELPVFASFLLSRGDEPLDYLDVGSGNSILPTFLALNSAYHVTVVDKFEWVHQQVDYLKRAGKEDYLSNGKFDLYQEDFLTVRLPDSAFDIVTALSVLEHIKEDGDSQAVRKAYRLLRPGGCLLISSPYNRSRSADYFVRRSVYGETPGRGGTFFQRHYSESTFEDRVLTAAPFELVKLFYAGHYRRPNLYKHVYVLPRPVKPIKALYAWATTKYAPRIMQLSLVPPSDSRPRMVTADTVFAVLRKPA